MKVLNNRIVCIMFLTINSSFLQGGGGDPSTVWRISFSEYAENTILNLWFLGAAIIFTITGEDVKR
jgi:hypothetical protein